MASIGSTRTKVSKVGNIIDSESDSDVNCGGSLPMLRRNYVELVQSVELCSVLLDEDRACGENGLALTVTPPGEDRSDPSEISMMNANARNEELQATRRKSLTSLHDIDGRRKMNKFRISPPLAEGRFSKKATGSGHAIGSGPKAHRIGSKLSGKDVAGRYCWKSVSDSTVATKSAINAANNNASRANGGKTKATTNPEKQSFVNKNEACFANSIPADKVDKVDRASDHWGRMDEDSGSKVDKCVHAGEKDVRAGDKGVRKNSIENVVTVWKRMAKSTLTPPRDLQHNLQHSIHGNRNHPAGGVPLMRTSCKPLPSLTHNSTTNTRTVATIKEHSDSDDFFMFSKHWRLAKQFLLESVDDMVAKKTTAQWKSVDTLWFPRILPEQHSVPSPIIGRKSRTAVPYRESDAEKTSERSALTTLAGRLEKIEEEQGLNVGQLAGRGLWSRRVGRRV
eukprot:gene18634-20516_t